jgi:hypothetical protein
LTGCVSFDQTRGKSSACEVHHIQMTKQEVRVVPGIAAPVYDGTLYPHAKREIVAGCTVPVQTGYIYVCPECDRLWHGRGDSDARYRGVVPQAASGNGAVMAWFHTGQPSRVMCQSASVPQASPA